MRVDIKDVIFAFDDAPQKAIVVIRHWVWERLACWKGVVWRWWHQGNVKLLNL